MEHLIQTIKDSERVKRSIQKKWNLDQFLEEASQREGINQQVKDMKRNFKISNVGYQSEDSSKSGKSGRRRNSKKKPPRPPRKRDPKKEEKEKGKGCGYCGKIGAHHPGRNCPAYGQQCLSGSLAKRSPLVFGTKNNFPSFFVSEKGLAHLYIKKQFTIFQFLHFVLLRAKIAFWPN